MVSHGEKDNSVPWDKIKYDFEYYLRNNNNVEIKVVKGLKHFMNRESWQLMKHFLSKNSLPNKL